MMNSVEVESKLLDEIPYMYMRKNKKINYIHMLIDLHANSKYLTER